jgi:hypothetical protein
MTHQCELEDDVGCCLEDNGKLWIQEYVTELGMMSGRKYEVTFCPVCGFKMPNKSPFNFLHLPYTEADDSIGKFSHSLSVAISQMNHNVELIKCFMSSQNTQNECFMDRDLQTSQKMCELERRIASLEKN